MATKNLDLNGTGAWLQGRLGSIVWISISAGQQRPVLTGQGELRYEPSHLDTQERLGHEAETEQQPNWYRPLQFSIGSSFHLHIGANFRRSTEEAGVLRIDLDQAEVTLTDDFWKLFRRDSAEL